MTFFELFLIGIGLSMDAFAVSICKGLSMQKIDKMYTLCIGLFFGGFQALMPLAGYLLGSQFSGYIERSIIISLSFFAGIDNTSPINNETTTNTKRYPRYLK